MNSQNSVVGACPTSTRFLLQEYQLNKQVTIVMLQPMNGQNSIVGA